MTTLCNQTRAWWKGPLKSPRVSPVVVVVSYFSTQKRSSSPPLSRRRTVSVMASCSMFENVGGIETAKTVAIQRAKERRNPPSKPLPYALTKLMSSDPEEQSPSKVKLGPRSNRPPVPSLPNSATTTPIHDETSEETKKAALASGLKSPPDTKTVPSLPAKTGRAALGPRPTRPPVPPPVDSATTPPHERVSKSSKPPPPSTLPKRNTSPVKAPSQAKTSPTKAYRLPTTSFSPPTDIPPRFCPSTERKASASSLPPRTVQRVPPPIPSPYSSNALELLKNRSWTLDSGGGSEPAPPTSRKLAPSLSNPSTLTRDVSPRRGVGQTLPTSFPSSAAASSTGTAPSPSKYNSAVTTAPPKAPVYEEIKDWIKGHDGEQCMANPRAVTMPISGWTVPQSMEGAVVHSRSDSSDADEYVDMKSFLEEESSGKLCM